MDTVSRLPKNTKPMIFFTFSGLFIRFVPDRISSSMVQYLGWVPFSAWLTAVLLSPCPRMSEKGLSKTGSLPPMTSGSRCSCQIQTRSTKKARPAARPDFRLSGSNMPKAGSETRRGRERRGGVGHCASSRRDETNRAREESWAESVTDRATKAPEGERMRPRQAQRDGNNE